MDDRSENNEKETEKKSLKKKERLRARIDAIVTEIKRIHGGIRKL
jgi:hypothetical protein